MRRSWLFVLLLTILILLLTACPEKQDLLGTLTMLEPVGQGRVEPEVGEHSFVKTVSVDLKAEPAEGWQFDKWLIDEEEIFEAETTVIIEGDIDSVAHFIEIPTAEYTLT